MTQNHTIAGITCSGCEPKSAYLDTVLGFPSSMITFIEDAFMIVISLILVITDMD